MIRFATQADTPQIRELFELCFAEEGGFNAFFFAQVFQAEHTLLCEREGRIAAMLQRVPHQLQMQGERVPVSYIYGACTHPEARRQSLMRQLLLHAHALDAQQGVAASVLIPQEAWLFDFYRQFGYEKAFFAAKREGVHCGAEEAPAVRLTTANIDDMQRLYTAASGACHMVRSHADWAQQLALFDTLGAGALGFYEGKRLVAYAFCWQDSVQEGIGLTRAHINTLLTRLSCERIPITGVGCDLALGCACMHGGAQSIEGYMNLMFN